MPTPPIDSGSPSHKESFHKHYVMYPGLSSWSCQGPRASLGRARSGQAVPEGENPARLAEGVDTLFDTLCGDHRRPRAAPTAPATAIPISPARSHRHHQRTGLSLLPDPLHHRSCKPQPRGPYSALPHCSSTPWRSTDWGGASRVYPLKLPMATSVEPYFVPREETKFLTVPPRSHPGVSTARPRARAASAMCRS
jgi:hypothetical protein